MNCGNCTYWNRQNEDGSEYGECIRFPPQYVEFGSPSEFPKTHAKIYCAEWAQNDDPGEDVTHGQLHKEICDAAIAILKRWYNDNQEEKLEPLMKKLQLALTRDRVW
jgi:hypothetical protein